MTLEEFKNNLLIEHKRDKKLTLIGFLLITLVLISLVVVGMIFIPDSIIGALKQYDTIGDNSGEYAIYYKILVPVILIGYLAYPIYKLRVLNKRPKRIDRFISRIEEGLIAESISEKTVYKIIIPLIKIKLNLCPVEILSVSLANDYDLGYNFSGYNFPIPHACIADAKIVLSGQSINELNKSWSELYVDDNSKESVDNVPLKSKEEFQAFYESDLKTDTEDIEKNRKSGKSTYIISVVIIGIIAVGWMSINYLMSTGKLVITTPVLIGGFIGFFVIFYVVMYFWKIKGKTNGVMETSLNHSFKINIFKKIVDFINPSFKYVLHGHITQEEFLETGLFQDKLYAIDGNDQIMGNHNNTPFQFCDLNVSRTRTLSNEKDAPDEVFFGQMFIAQFNKSFNTELYLIPKKSGGLLKGNDIKDHLNFNLGDKVILEDPEFMKMYNVYSNDQVEARYIMSTALMQRIKELTLKTNGKYFISFRNNRISVANNSQKNNFETKLFKTTDNNLMQDFYQDLCNQLIIIDDLKLNVKIWK